MGLAHRRTYMRDRVVRVIAEFALTFDKIHPRGRRSAYFQVVREIFFGDCLVYGHEASRLFLRESRAGMCVDVMVDLTV